MKKLFTFSFTYLLTYLLVFSPLILKSQQVTFSPLKVDACCGNEEININVEGEYLNNGECGDWKLSIELDYDDAIGCIQDIGSIEWNDYATHQREFGESVYFHFSTISSTVEVKFNVTSYYYDPQEPEGYCSEIVENVITVNVTQPYSCNGCRSVINYCETFPCTGPFIDVTDYSHDLISVKMIDEFGNCFILNSQNDFGLFTFPYNLNNPPNCPAIHPNLYDFIYHLNIFLSYSYGHFGYARLIHFNTAGECKIKIEIVDSDLTMDKWTTMGHKVVDCNRKRICGYAYPLAEFKSCFSLPDYCSLTSGNIVEENDPSKSEIRNEEFLVSRDIVDNKITVKIYPTLAIDILKIEVQTDLKDEFNISILDVSGHIIKDYFDINKRDLLVIDLINYNPGLYFVKLKSKLTGESKIIKFVKQ